MSSNPIFSHFDYYNS